MAFRTPADEAELNTVTRILSEAFSAPPERLRERLPVIGEENLRVLTRGDDIAATLWLIPMGQYFGGRSVPMTGVAGVGVGPDHRGAGAAHELMSSAMRELRAKGIALSGLYPATQTLYRKSGYEQAGARFELNMALDRIRIKDHRLPARRLGPADAPKVEALYREHAPWRSGHLDRPFYIWDRVYRPYGETTYGYGVEGENGLEGYVYIQHRDKTGGFYNLTLTDFFFATERAGRRLLTLLGEHASMAENVRWYGGPDHPAIFLLAEQRFQLEARFYWMIRITHLEAALAARGYPPHMTAELHLEVADDIVPEHNGRFTLRVDDGVGAVMPGGRGDLKLDIRDLAALFSGYRSGEALGLAGRIEGPADAIRTATALFAGPYPSMPDMF